MPARKSHYHDFTVRIRNGRNDLNTAREFVASGVDFVARHIEFCIGFGFPIGTVRLALIPRGGERLLVIGGVERRALSLRDRLKR